MAEELDEFEFGEATPNLPLNMDNLIGNVTRWVLSTLLSTPFYRPPTRVQASRYAYVIYCFHAAGAFTFLLLSLEVPLPFHAAFQIQLLLYLFVLWTLFVFWFCCLLVEFYAGIWNFLPLPARALQTPRDWEEGWEGDVQDFIVERDEDSFSEFEDEDIDTEFDEDLDGDWDIQ